MRINNLRMITSETTITISFDPPINLEKDQTIEIRYPIVIIDGERTNKLHYHWYSKILQWFKLIYSN